MKSAIFTPQVFAFFLLVAVGYGPLAFAQSVPQAGLWKFVITTDLSRIAEDMRDNFPEIDYEKCLTEEQIGSPQSFGLQASPAMWNRCSTENYTLSDGRLAYQFQCDGGTTLSGEVVGEYTSNRVTLRLTSRPRPIVRGIDTIYQRIVAKRLGACKNPT